MKGVKMEIFNLPKVIYRFCLKLNYTQIQELLNVSEPNCIKIKDNLLVNIIKTR